MSVIQRTGDCRDVLPTLPAASVHCVVTSPPYWGLRDYGTATWEGGDPACDHRKVAGRGRIGKSTLGPYGDGRSGQATNGHQQEAFRSACGHCGAIRIDAQLGLEPDFNAYVAGMVAVFREVRRVLRDDGTLWLNLGDSYCPENRGENAKPRSFDGYAPQLQGEHFHADLPTSKSAILATKANGVKRKDLCGIPWRVAFALQADGWYLRQDIIWSKPNPMPESVTDRCTKAHEYLFLLSKRERYYYDAEAIKEDGANIETQRSYSVNATESIGNTGGNKRTDFEKDRHTVDTRNKRSVWEVTTQPFSEAHFATFPPALIEPCIKAGCPVGGTVLDPFGGAGTTGLVADRLQRNAILIELNPAYATMAGDRITGDAPLFAVVSS